jgi:hypothetical protein
VCIQCGKLIKCTMKAEQPSLLVEMFVLAVEETHRGVRPMMDWDELYDLCGVPTSDRTHFGSGAILKQAIPILRKMGVPV